MKIKKSKILHWLLIIALLLFHLRAAAQVMDIKELPNVLLTAQPNLKLDSPIDILIRNISGFDNYPDLSKFKGQHIFFIKDSLFGKLPFKMFIPADYNPSKRHPLILLLHGAVGQSKFEDSESAAAHTDDDPFYSKLCQSGFIVVKPFADRQRGFNWAANKMDAGTNFTFNALIGLINELKKSINVDDNKVFAFGHSDGSDGAFALDVYHPSPFAGFVAYNSMLTILFAHNYYIANAVNRPLHLVHSDKDDLRPIEQARDIIKILYTLQVPLEYKEYYGYVHEDKHLEIDYPNGVNFINKTTRSPYPKSIYWETSDHFFAKCDWLILDEWDMNLPRASWHQRYNVKGYNKITHAYYPFNYYDENESAAIKGVYTNNVFDISTSRVTRFDLLISAEMVDLGKEVIVLVNGKQAFKGRVKADSKFYLSQIEKNQDRKTTWVNAITINVER